MRVVAGILRGRNIEAPKGMATRPTSDRVREAIFSALVSRYGLDADTRVGDLFAGSGALGIEALSRGAGSAVFVESDRSARVVLSRNLTSLDLTSRATVDARDTFRAGASLAGRAPFALLFLDPPYRIEAARIRELLAGLAAGGALMEGGVVVYEHRTGGSFEWPAGFESDGERTYGETTVSYGVYTADRETTG